LGGLALELGLELGELLLVWIGGGARGRRAHGGRWLGRDCLSAARAGGGCDDDANQNEDDGGDDARGHEPRPLAGAASHQRHQPSASWNARSLIAIRVS